MGKHHKLRKTSSLHDSKNSRRFMPTVTDEFPKFVTNIIELHHTHPDETSKYYMGDLPLLDKIMDAAIEQGIPNLSRNDTKKFYTIKNSLFNTVNLKGVIYARSSYDVYFQECHLEHIDFSDGFSVKSVKLIDCYIMGVDFSNSGFFGALEITNKDPQTSQSINLQGSQITRLNISVPSNTDMTIKADGASIFSGGIEGDLTLSIRHAYVYSFNFKNIINSLNATQCFLNNVQFQEVRNSIFESSLMNQVSIASSFGNNFKNSLVVNSTILSMADDSNNYANVTFEQNSFANQKLVGDDTTLSRIRMTRNDFSKFSLFYKGKEYDTCNLPTGLNKLPNLINEYPTSITDPDSFDCNQLLYSFLISGLITIPFGIYIGMRIYSSLKKNRQSSYTVSEQDTSTKLESVNRP